MKENIENIADDINLSAGEDPNDKQKVGSPLTYLFDILFTGNAGWKRLRRSRLSPEQTAAGCFYPILALVAVCRFADWFYLPEFDISSTLIQAASIFASFFFSYFAVQVVCRLLFPSEAKAKADTSYFKLLVQYALASLALFWLPTELLPVLEPLAVFLPIWTIFIITKGARFLRLPEAHTNRCLITIIVATVAMPYLFMWIADKIF